MKFSFNNIGNIQSGQVELGDLTILCGPNNVGKTYVSYAIYGLIKQLKSTIYALSTPRSVPEQLAKELIAKQQLTVTIEELKPYIREFLVHASQDFSDYLPEFFSVPDDFFQADRSITLELNDNLLFDSAKTIKSKPFEFRSAMYSLEKEAGSSFVTFRLQKNTSEELPIEDVQIAMTATLLINGFQSSLPEPFVVTSERTGITLFYKELDINKNILVDQIGKLSETNNRDFMNTIANLFNLMRSRYARPIQDNINTVRDHESQCKRKSFLAEHKSPAIQALKDLLGGSYKNINKQVTFVSSQRGKNRFAVPVYVASSSIKSLFLLDHYINNLAPEHGFLLIDEPELNLHPDNQRKMAKVLARLVNSGIKVLITTHSDFILRELNNMISLNMHITGKDKLMKEAGITHDDLLLPSRIKAYSIKKQEIHPVLVDEHGVSMDDLDEIISEASYFAEMIRANMPD